MCAHPDGYGGMHSELNAFAQILAFSEMDEEVETGSTMQFCFHFGEEYVRKAYEVRKEDAAICTQPASCDFSPYQFVAVDRLGVNWCIFV